MTAKMAFLFPGQGQLPSVVPRMTPHLENLYKYTEEAGLALRDWIRSSQTERLSETDAAQPAVFLDSLARVERLESMELVPDVVAGHSLGEYAALVAAGVLTADAALPLVVRRGQLMARIQGGMTALLKLDLPTVSKLCADVGRGAVVANYNGENQFVVSAPLDALEDIEHAAASRGGRAIRLAVSGPFHSPAMEPAERALADVIASTPFAAPRCAFVSSVTGGVEEDPLCIKALLMKQITASVRWTDVLRTLSALGVQEAFEVGCGNVLTQLGRRAEAGIRFRAFEEVVHV